MEGNGPRLTELRRGLAAYAQAFRPARLNAAEALAVLEEAAAAERLAGSIKALAAARVAETKVLEKTGGSTAEHLAKLSGTSTKSAKEALAAGEAATKRPVTGEALRHGKLSTAQAALVAQGAQADPGAEERLVRQAQQGSHKELRDAVAATTAAADPDPEARRRRIHDRRNLSSWSDSDGSWHLQVVDNPERGAVLLAALKPFRERLFAAARRAGRQERPGALDCDALHQAVTGISPDPECPADPKAASPARPASPGPGTKGPGTKGSGTGRPTLLIRADAAALVRGQVAGNEVCEVVGVGPVTPGAVRDLTWALEPFIALLLQEGTEITRVVHLGRRPTAEQRSVLWWLYPTCAAEGCSNLRLEWDHRQEWSKTHHTTLSELDGLCTRCHRLKTVQGWALVNGTGKRPFVAPQDPRHPDHRRGPSPRRSTARAGPSPPLADSA